MNDQFDELTRSMAQSVTRRGALKKFGLGLAGMALAYFGLANQAGAGTIPNWCDRSTNLCCCRGCKTHLPKSDADYSSCASICSISLGCGHGKPKF